jgi:polysaccharide export outer membrane protein
VAKVTIDLAFLSKINATSRHESNQAVNGLLGARFRRRDFVALVSCAALGWASSAFGAPITVESALPPPDPAHALAPNDYRIGPLDELDVVVYQDKDLTQTVDVDGSGRIVLPFVGQVEAAGKTPAELAALITAKLSESYFQRPQVAVLVKKAVSQQITVEGEVTKPGVYPIAGRTTLMQAIALASGANQYADERRIMVFRDVNGRRYGVTYNLDRVDHGQSPDPEVYVHDIIVVPRSGIKTKLRDYIGPLAPVIYTLPIIIPKL